MKTEFYKIKSSNGDEWIASYYFTSYVPALPPRVNVLFHVPFLHDDFQ